MKKFCIVLLSVFCALAAMAQNEGEFYYKQGLEKAEAGDLEKAVELFDKSIAIKGDEYVAWYNRGIVKSMMGRYEDALADLEQTIKLNSAYKKAYLNRGTAKKHLTDFGGAIADYTRAIQLDSAYGEAYYDRGIVYELFDKTDYACKDFTKAKELGFTSAEKRVSLCAEPMRKNDIHPVIWIEKKSDNRRYGFASESPIKIGTGYDGGPANERAYLELLRDPKGNPVRYQRISSCCGYSSINAPKGLALLDKYQMWFYDENGEQKIVYVYFSFYDYEEPQILYGFHTVSKVSSLY